MRDAPAEGLAFSPDGSQAIIAGMDTCLVLDTKTWKGRKIHASAYSIQFLPDGHHALLKTRKQPLKIYDTTTWQPVDHLPTRARWCDAMHTCPENPRVPWCKPPASAVTLWDTAASRPIVQLAENTDLPRAAFSPGRVDGRRRHPPARNVTTWVGAFPLDIWLADTGQKLHDLRQFTRVAYSDDETSDLLWLPDGPAPPVEQIRASALFDIQTGRQRARLASNHRINGVVLLPGGKQLAVGSTEVKILFWDFPPSWKTSSPSRNLCRRELK